MDDPTTYAPYVGYGDVECMYPTAHSDLQGNGARFVASQVSPQETVVRSAAYHHPLGDLAPNLWLASRSHDSQYESLYQQPTLDCQFPQDATTSFTDGLGLSEPFVPESEPAGPSQQMHPWSPTFALDVPGLEGTSFFDPNTFDMRRSNASWGDPTLPGDGSVYYTGMGGLESFVPEVPEFDGRAAMRSYNAKDVEDGQPGIVDASYDLPEQFSDPAYVLNASSSSSLSAYDTQTPSTPLLVHQSQSVPPGYLSSYSELSANVAHLFATGQEDHTPGNGLMHQPSPRTWQAPVEIRGLNEDRGVLEGNGKSRETFSRRRHRPSSSVDEPNTTRTIPPPPPDSSFCTIHHSSLPPHATPLEHVPSRSSNSSADSSSSRSLASNNAPLGPTTHVLRFREVPLRTASGNKGKRPPGLACFLCRGRKIACGRPAEGSADPTCNQCRRRGGPCEYPRESLRGLHRRGGT